MDSCPLACMRAHRHTILEFLAELCISHFLWERTTKDLSVLTCILLPIMLARGGAFYGFKNIFIILFYVYMCFAHMSIWVAHVCNVHRGQRRVADPLGPELQMAVSCAVGAGFLNPGSMEEQPVFLSTELSPSPGYHLPSVFFGLTPDSRVLRSWRLISSTYRFLFFSPESPPNFSYMVFL